MGKRIRKGLRLCFIFCVCMFVAGLFNRGEAYASVNQQETETEKVAVDKTVAIADTAKYKQMDYSFLKSFQYGSSVHTTKEFSTVDAMKKTNIAKGVYVRTKGYYTIGDGGAACYLVTEQKETGGIKLENGLFANIQPDTYVDKTGKKWVIGSVLQYGAKADGKQADEDAINNAIKSIGIFANETTSYECERGLIYMPAGEYKCADKLRLGYSNINLVGDGNDTILFTDNDYRKEEGYSEFFFEIWGANHIYVANFQVEAREVDLYHYMRQFVVLYSSQVYIYQVNLLIPQGAYSSYYFEDKQYSNFCCYTGNKNVTVDGCKMEQMSGTYRGANVGILDIWSAGEENIAIMNCDFYGNARDEQFGFFSKNDEKAYVRHVDFINNTVHSVQLKYPDIIGTRTMCFTVAYADSKNVEDIRIAGNHFICEADSKFMTFGNIKDCVVEENIIEIKCTYQTWSMVFDSSNANAEDILIRKNAIFLTSDYNIGKGNLCGGNVTLKENRIFSDVELAFGILGPEIHDNTIIFLKNMSRLATNANCTKNKIYIYKGLGCVGTNKKQIVNYGGDKNASYCFCKNEIFDYERADKLGIFQSLIMLDGDLKSLEVSDNKYYMPNSRFLSNEYSQAIAYQDEKGVYYKNNIFRKRSGNYGSVIVKNNVFPMVELEESDDIFSYEKNQSLEPTGNLEEDLCSSVKILKNGIETTEITVTGDTVDLGVQTFVAQEKDSNGKVIKEKKVSGKQIRWYTSVEKIATVSDSGKVTRKLYGDVFVYAVPLDGSGVYGKCVVHFAKKQASTVTFKEKQIQLQPGLKYYMEYSVLPKGAEQHLIWTSSDDTIAKVDQNGTIVAVAEGEVVITGATVENPKIKAEIMVKVSPVTVKQIILNESILHADYTQIGTTKQLKALKYVPDNAKNPGIKKWESSDKDVATVKEDGTVTFVGGGVATITAYSMDLRCFATCKVYVQFPAVKNLSVKEYTNDTVVLQWEQMQRAEGYRIYQWDKKASEWNVLNNGNLVKDTSFTINALEKASEYSFLVKACNIGWDTGEKVVYEGEENKVSVKTMAYIPVTKLWCSSEIVGVARDCTYTLTCTYSPITANYEQLQPTFLIEDTKIAKIESVKQIEKGKYELTIKGVSYGTTMLTYAVNDKWALKKEIPVGVVTKEMLPQENVTVTASAVGAKIQFKAYTKEKQMLEEGAISGYMIRRTNSIAFSNVKYIPADGSQEYVWEDKDVIADKDYSYTIAPCLKMESHCFLGYDNGYHTVKIPKEVDIKVMGYEGEYDGQKHDAVIITGITEEDSISYSENGKVWVPYIPTVKNVSDSKVIYVSIVREEKMYSFQTIAKVLPKSVTKIKMRLEHKQFYWDGKVHHPKVLMEKSIGAEDYDVIYQGTRRNVGKSTVIIQGKGNYKDNRKLYYEIKLKKGQVFIQSGYKYQYLGGNKAAILGSNHKKRTSIRIPDTIQLGGKKVKVVKVKAKAFANYKKLVTVKIGKNITKIERQAFAGDKKLKKCIFTSGAVASFGKDTWKGIVKTASFYVPKKYVNHYKKLFTKKSGFVKKMKIKRK